MPSTSVSEASTDFFLENKARSPSRKTGLSRKDLGSVSDVFSLRPITVALSLLQVFSQSYCCLAYLLDQIFLNVVCLLL